MRAQLQTTPSERLLKKIVAGWEQYAEEIGVLNTGYNF
jgi:hypothetical protein